ncbi:mechanosensitive ion channel family protein [Haloferacaceae archaeon DSL9]
MQGRATISSLDALFGSLATVELRVLATALVLVVALGASRVIVPKAVFRGRSVAHRTLRRRTDSVGEQLVDRTARTIPIGLVLVAVIRALQFGLLLVTAFAVLIIWRQYGIVFAALAVLSQSLPVAGRAALTGGILLGAHVGIGLLDDIVEVYAERSDRITAHQEEILVRVLQVGFLALVAATTLGIWGVNLGGLLVGAGFLGIVVGLAAQQTVGALIAGFVLMFSRPFEIGDWVVIGDAEGIVTDVTIMNTRLRNFDGERLIMPNDRVADELITNRTREGQLRVQLEIGIDYDADPARAADLARATLEDLDAVASNPKPVVSPFSFGDSAVVLDARFWIAPPTPQRRRRATAAAVAEIKDAFEREGIGIPFPQRVVSHRDPADGDGSDGDGADASPATRGVDERRAADLGSPTD